MLRSRGIDMPKIVNSFTADTGLNDVLVLDLYVVENDIVYNMYVVHNE